MNQCYVFCHAGTYLAQSIIDEKYIAEVVLGGEDSLPSIDNFIPCKSQSTVGKH